MQSHPSGGFFVAFASADPLPHHEETMQHSDAPFAELEHARRAIQNMGQAKSLEDLEEFWKEYLRRLERVWSKSVSHFGKSPKWNGWQGKFLKLRKNDPLLSYFINARGAEEHTGGEITERDPGWLNINFGPGDHAYVERMVIENGMLKELRGPKGLVFEFRPARVKPLPITNRGVIYPVPAQHLSKAIDPNNLLDIAERGVTFYAGFLDEAESFFIHPARANR